MMAFPGLPDAKQRADVLAFLRTKNDNPPPLPEVAAAAPAAAPGRRGGETRGRSNLEVAALVAKADPAKGEEVAEICKVCHTFDKGGAEPDRPQSLWRARPRYRLASKASTIPALKAKGGKWDYAMSTADQQARRVCAGHQDGLPRACPMPSSGRDVILFLRTKNDNPLPAA